MPAPSLTAGSAALLHAGGVTWADEAADDLRNNGDDAVTETTTGRSSTSRLGRPGSRTRCGACMVRALDDLAMGLSLGREPRPEVRREAVALDQMISAAKCLAPDAQDVLGPGWAAVAHADPGEEGAEPWETLRDLLFEDRDFDMLSDPALDDLEDDQLIGDRLGMDLRGHIWFRPYPWAQPTDPLRGVPDAAASVTVTARAASLGLR